MLTVDINELARDLLAYLPSLVDGEPIVILQAGQPIAELKPLPTNQPVPRPFGLCAGEFVTPKDFNAPLPEEALAVFEGR